MRPFAFEGWIAGAVICGAYWGLAGLIAGAAMRLGPHLRFRRGNRLRRLEGNRQVTGAPREPER